MPAVVYLVRHGQTEWSKSGQHTGRTDLPLTEEGQREVAGLRPLLGSTAFTEVFTSPAIRARATCELVGMAGSARVDPDLAEWDYGAYEGRRTAEILAERPDWNLFADGCPGGESPLEVSRRCDRLIGRWSTLDGTIAVFCHGHIGRALAVRWLGLPVSDGRRFLLGTASIGVLAWEHGRPAEAIIARWNLSGA